MEQRLDMLATKRKEPNSTFSPSPTSTRCCDGELDVYQATQGHTVLSPRSSTRTSLKIVTASLTARAPIAEVSCKMQVPAAFASHCVPTFAAVLSCATLH